MAEVELYSYWRSSSAYRIRIALAHKGIHYTYAQLRDAADFCSYKAVNLLSGGQHDEAYIKLNPMHEVPTLHIDGHFLNQSMSILEYLEEKHPSHPLLPKDLYHRQIARQVAQIIVADIQPVQNLRVMKKLSPTETAPREQWAHYWITEGFKALEAVLAKSAGRCCVGDEVTFADCCLVPQVYNARRFKVDMALFPTITRVDAALLELPAFKQAHPSIQPDAEKPNP